MANTITSPNMNLSIPVPGVDPGPDYALNLNACLATIDQHNHSSGQGVQINPSGININADLPMANNNLTLARSIRFAAQSAPLSLVTDLGCLYESGVDLYYNDGSGNQVRITQSGGVAGTPGSISNLVSPASAAYVSANQTFVWQSAASTPANLDAGSIILRNITANSKGLTLNPPNAMSVNFSITLPSLPLVTSLINIDASGNMGTWALDNSTLTQSAGIIQVPASGITATQLAANSVTTAKILNNNVTPAKLSAPNYAVTSVQSNSTTSTTLVDTGLTVNVTVSGLRPVLVMLQNSGTSFGSWGANTAGNALFLAFLRSGTIISYSASDNFGPSTATNYAASCFSYIDFPSAGTYTYKVQYKTTSSGDVNFSNTQLIVLEL